MKKIFILSAIASLGFFSSYSQDAAAKRHVPELNATKKVDEVKIDRSLEAEKAAKLNKKSTSNTADLHRQQDAEKMKIEEMQKAKSIKKQTTNNSIKASESNSSTLTPNKKN